MNNRSIINGRNVIAKDRWLVSFIKSEWNLCGFLILEGLDEKEVPVRMKAELVPMIMNKGDGGNRFTDVARGQIRYQDLSYIELTKMQAEQSKYTCKEFTFYPEEKKRFDEKIHADQRKEILYESDYVRKKRERPRYGSDLPSPPPRIGHNCISWAQETIKYAKPEIDVTSGFAKYVVVFDIRSCNEDKKVRFCVARNALRPNARWYNPWHWRPYSKKEILNCLSRDSVEISEESSYRPIFYVEAPEWFELVLYDKPPPEVSSGVIQRVLNAKLGDREILCNYLPPSHTSRWIIGAIILSASIVAGLMWYGIIIKPLTALITGGANLLFVGLFKKGRDWLKKRPNAEDALEETELFEHQIPDDQYSERKRTSSPREEKSHRSNPNRLKFYIERQLEHYDRYKGYRRLGLGDQKDIEKLRALMNGIASDILSPVEMFRLCQIMMEETTEIGHASYEVFNKIKQRMTKRSEQYLPLVVAQFLQYMNLWHQANFDRLCALSFREQKIICRIMQVIPERHRTQFVFDFLCSYANNIRHPQAAEKMLVFMLDSLPPALRSKENYQKLFAWADYYYENPEKEVDSKVNYAKYFDQFCAVFQAIPVPEHTQDHLDWICALPKTKLGLLHNIVQHLPTDMQTKRQLKTLSDLSNEALTFIHLGMDFYISKAGRADPPREIVPLLRVIYKDKSCNSATLKDKVSTEDYFSYFLGHFITARQIREVMAQRLSHLGKNSWFSLLGGPGQAQPKDPMAEIGELKLATIIAPYI